MHLKISSAKRRPIFFRGRWITSLTEITCHSSVGFINWVLSAVSCVNSPPFHYHIRCINLPEYIEHVWSVLEFLILILAVAHRQKDGFRESALTHLSPQMESGGFGQIQPFVANENSDISNVTSNGVFKYGVFLIWRRNQRYERQNPAML